MGNQLITCQVASIRFYSYTAYVKLKPYLTAPQLYSSHLLLLLASMVLLGAALLSQYGFGLKPCHLCLLQRYPYALVIFFSIAGIALHTRFGFSLSMLALSTLALAADAAIAFYHAGVEKKWFAGPSGCVDDAPHGQNIDALRESILQKPLVLCDQPVFEFLGLSMAGWNALAALCLFGFGMYCLAHITKHHRHGA